MASRKVLSPLNTSSAKREMKIAKSRVNRRGNQNIILFCWVSMTIPSTFCQDSGQKPVLCLLFYADGIPPVAQFADTRTRDAVRKLQAEFDRRLSKEGLILVFQLDRIDSGV